MAVHKPKRSAPTIDMTAMVDVAFLLLTFFILTTTSFREDSAVQVDAPSSVSSKEPPAKQLMTINVTDSGTVFVGYSDIGTREDVLSRMAQANADAFIKLSDDGRSLFASMENFGVPIKELPLFLNIGEEERKAYRLKGVPYKDDPNTPEVNENELKMWILQGRYADPYMKFGVKADAKAPMPVINEVISTLQDYNINQMLLITNLEEAPETL